MYYVWIELYFLISYQKRISTQVHTYAIYQSILSKQFQFIPNCIYNHELIEILSAFIIIKSSSTRFKQQNSTASPWNTSLHQWQFYGACIL